MTEPTHPIIRDYRPDDWDAAYYICLKTGNRGGDGELLFAADPDALGRIYTGPYLEFEPDLALMLEDDEGLCGYALGALDTRKFYDRYEREWRPGLCAQFPDPSGDCSDWTPVESVYQLYHHPEYYFPDAYESYPSHLHIDLLPRAQRQGHGRRMMDALMERLRRKGAPGVHLGMSAANVGAHQFYLSLGFEELSREADGEDTTVYLGMKFD